LVVGEYENKIRFRRSINEMAKESRGKDEADGDE